MQLFFLEEPVDINLPMTNAYTNTPAASQPASYVWGKISLAERRATTRTEDSNFHAPEGSLLQNECVTVPVVPMLLPLSLSLSLALSCGALQLSGPGLEQKPKACQAV